MGVLAFVVVTTIIVVGVIMLENSSDYTCSHCGKTEHSSKPNGPDGWDCKFISDKPEYRGRQFWLCPQCYKQLYSQYAKVKEDFLLGKDKKH